MKSTSFHVKSTSFHVKLTSFHVKLSMKDELKYKKKDLFHVKTRSKEVSVDLTAK